MMTKPKQPPHLRVRIPTTLLARLEKAREKNGRTLTGEIVHRLAESFRKDDAEARSTAMGVAMAEILLDAAGAGGTRPSKEEIRLRIDELMRKRMAGEKI
jgi:hypothetical protein